MRCWQALEPLYTEGEPVEPYEWAGAHADAYDPEAQNAWGDLPMFVSAPASAFSLLFNIHCHYCRTLFVAILCARSPQNESLKSLHASPQQRVLRMRGESDSRIHVF
jgi:hypothetical protein